tara:strand:+ start:23 stop:298 length:276 start_codon:yes stop_codon:yes gene_type:complete
MDIQWEIIQALSVGLVFLFCYMLKDHQSRLQKEIDNLRGDFNDLRQVTPSDEVLKVKLQSIEDQIKSLENKLLHEISSKMELFETKLNSKK